MQEISVKEYKKIIKPNILIFDDSVDAKEVYVELISKGIYPLTKGLPFCCGDIQHCVEIFRREKKENNFSKCNGCKLKTYCPYHGKNFDVSPITNPNKDLMKWLEDENPAIRL